MESNLHSYMRPKYALAAVGVLLLISLASSSGIRYMFKIHSEIRKVKREIAAIEKESKLEEAKLQGVKDNPRLLEIYARTKLGMVKPDEIVYEIK
jgi:cell division protein FtsB